MALVPGRCWLCCLSVHEDRFSCRLESVRSSYRYIPLLSHSYIRRIYWLTMPDFDALTYGSIILGILPDHGTGDYQYNTEPETEGSSESDNLNTGELTAKEYVDKGLPGTLFYAKD